jgi:hypothetical protein
MKIARVFPRITKATPQDEYTFYGPPGLVLPEIDEVHVSVTFTDDLKAADKLATAWGHIAPVKVGGPAFDDPGGEFFPGRYLRPGYVITSRGCPNRCWFCPVWKREGPKIRELEIKEGNIVQDDNLLRCSDAHIKAVFAMLKRQTYGKPEFKGGLEAARLKDWHIEELVNLKPKQVFFAYDTPDDLEPLIEAGKKLAETPLSRGHTLRCYVLIGWAKDTFEQAEKRLWQTIKAGFMPMAMLYKDPQGKVREDWKGFQREWANDFIVGAKMKEG